MNKIEFGDCRDTMRRWAQQGIKAQMCVTSPPYYGLRDYGHSGQIGLEPTPEQYVAAMVEVFDCVRNVLADDGVLWLNIGDSYAAQRSGTHQPAETLAGGRNGKTDDGQMVNRDRHAGYNPTRNAAAIGLKHKDLIGIPWMLAFALRSAGWYLRQDIIWHKPNPMPESVTDRCTKAHEYLFLLSKSEKYFFETIKEPVGANSDVAYRNALRSSKSYDMKSPYAKNFPSSFDNNFRTKRSVWSVNTKPYGGAHFAVFPTELITPCILAGSREGDSVLDPFMGSGTTAEVAIKHGRHYLGCELNPQYRVLQEARIADATLERKAATSQLSLFEAEQ